MVALDLSESGEVQAGHEDRQTGSGAAITPPLIPASTERSKTLRAAESYRADFLKVWGQASRDAITPVMRAFMKDAPDVTRPAVKVLYLRRKTGKEVTVFDPPGLAVEPYILMAFEATFRAMGRSRIGWRFEAEISVNEGWGVWTTIVSVLTAEGRI